MTVAVKLSMAKKHWFSFARLEFCGVIAKAASAEGAELALIFIP
jgi:hypothetical protein